MFTYQFLKSKNNLIDRDQEKRENHEIRHCSVRFPFMIKLLAHRYRPFNISSCPLKLPTALLPCFSTSSYQEPVIYANHLLKEVPKVLCLYRSGNLRGLFLPFRTNSLTKDSPLT